MARSDERLSGSRPVALVTGAAKRVGLASARALARAGFDLVITYGRSMAEAERSAEQLRGLGAAVVPNALMLDDLDTVDAAGRALAKSLPRLDALVHNAASYERTPLETLTPEDVLSAFRVNAAAPLLLSRALAGLLAVSPRPGGGAIVAMADIHALGEHGLPRRQGFTAYSMSKAALVEMVRTLARELAPRVRVNAVALGVAAWPEQGTESEEAAQQAYLRNVPLARSGTPEEAAEAVRWLAVDAAYTTGQVLRVDGGRSLV